MLTTIAYNGKINVEFTKFAVVRYFEKNGQKHRLMSRPKSMMGNSTNEQMESKNLIGTMPTPKNINYAIQLLQAHIFEYWQQIWDEELLLQLTEFTNDEHRGKFDLVLSAFWTEVADEDQPIYINRSTSSEKIVKLGHFIDPATGILKYGVLPDSHHITSSDFMKHNNAPNPFMIDPHLYSNVS
jgi:hypothetical protein